jgi:rhomboid family protein
LIPIRDINPTRIFPIVTIALILVNIGAFIWQPPPETQEEVDFLYEHAGIACELTTGEPLSLQEARTDTCSSSPSDQPIFPEKNIWIAAFVSMFLHGGLLHIVGNMWFLWIFGNNVEEAFGSGGYLLMYLLSGIVATATFVFLNPDATVPLIGASGAIAGVLGSYLVLYPTHRVLALLFFFFVPVPAILFLGIWFFSQFGVGDTGVAWQAHVGGFLFGILITLPLREMLLRRVSGLHSTVRYV